MVMCPQVLQAGASLCMLLAAAFTASIVASALATFTFCAFAGCDAGLLPAAFATTLTSLNSGVFF
jgi:hypothetical protein